MNALSNSDASIIAQNPMGNGLDGFRRRLKAKCEDFAISCIEQLVQDFDIDAKDLAIELLHDLQSLALARVLKSRNSSGTLRQDILRLASQIGFDDFKILSIIPLFERVYSHASDVDICNALFVLFARPITPHQSTPPFTASFQQTPWTFSTGNFADTSELRKAVDPILKAEVEDSLIIDHPQFFDTFFGQIPQLLEMATAVFQMCKDSEPPLYEEGTGWAEWPEGREESRVLGWLSRHIEQLLLFASRRGFVPYKNRQIVTAPKKPIPGSVSKRKLDVGFIYNSIDEPINWSHILVPGELKSNPQEDNHRSTWLDLIKYMREVFNGQDTRRFVLGFTICGSLMRLWEFDRLGGVASRPFDLNKDGQMFVSAILGYLWMNEEELGFDPTVREGDAERYIDIQRNGLIERIYLEQLMQRQSSVVGRATICWRGYLNQNIQLAIKDSWQYEERPEEGLLLKEATEAGVEHIARYYHHETVHIGDAVDDIRNNVRKGLQDANGRNPFQERRPAISEHNTNLATSSIAKSSSLDKESSRSSTESIKRKRSSSSLPISIPPPKSSNLNSLVKQDIQPQCNRSHRRVIMCDVGKSIYHASSLRVMLTGLLGGIKGHESLLNAKILHRDISIGNIMLNEAEDDAFLIDLDLAIKIDREKASGAPSKTGTKVFMAIGALYGDDHNFMHDLESFFWVLFWLCAHWNGPGQKRSKTEYESWNFEPTKRLAQIKIGMVSEQDKFEKEVNENFAVHCKPLIPCIQELRKVVFPQGKRWLTQDRRLYSQMKLVLENARTALK